MDDERDQITDLLIAWREGDESALGRLMPRVEKELRRIAAGYFKNEASGHTLQPTALVNELYLRLVDRRRVSWKNRGHFLAFAAYTMRNILVDHARGRQAEKRGAGVRPLPLDILAEVEAPQPFDFLALDDALRRLAAIDPRQERVVVLRVFAGLTNEEIAEVVGVASRTVKRDWLTARLWLHKELEP